MFPEVDPVLGPEMRSTGEVLGLAGNFGEAFFKAQEATQTVLPLSGTVLITVNNRDKEEAVDVAREFERAGFSIIATAGTGAVLAEHGISCGTINKQGEGRPDILDAITNSEIDFVINTPSSTQESAVDDSYIRKAAHQGPRALHDDARRRHGKRPGHPGGQGRERGKRHVVAGHPRHDRVGHRHTEQSRNPIARKMGFLSF